MDILDGVGMATSAKRWLSRLGLLLGLALCGAFPSWANGGVRFVYRFDTRPPEQIFASGFSPRGSDTSLIRHVLAWTEESAFVAATSSLEVATSLAITYLEANPGAVGFIYRIQADESFYEAIPSLEHFLAQERGAGIDPRHYYTERGLDYVIPQFTWQREFVATVPIRLSSISWALSYSSERGTDNNFHVRPGSYRHNTAWTGDSATFANTAPYTVTWPEDDASSSPSLAICSPAVGAISQPAGMNCTNDVYGAAEGGAEDGDPIHLALLPSCASPKEKRGDSIRFCFSALRIVNMSSRMRVDAEIQSEVGAGENWRWRKNDDL
ncbi:scabin-related ADP-ribosyltransferase [Dyella sp. 2RAB6]|uniref:scabin-related ADP-ribosyltransferase n=1 Tax=Dyella sp. 2RAB6 TaxID=3232992 RepID=UPI003F91A0D4